MKGEVDYGTRRCEKVLVVMRADIGMWKDVLCVFKCSQFEDG